MFLESVPDNCDDVTHARLDEMVLKTADYEPSSLPLATFLLATIVSTSKETLGQKYMENSNTRALLQENPTLIEKLNGAWRDRTLKEIRNLSAIPLF